MNMSKQRLSFKAETNISILITFSGCKKENCTIPKWILQRPVFLTVNLKGVLGFFAFEGIWVGRTTAGQFLSILYPRLLHDQRQREILQRVMVAASSHIVHNLDRDIYGSCPSSAARINHYSAVAAY